MELFPGSAKDDSRLAPWVLHFREGVLYSLHVAPSPESFAGFWLALEAVLSQELGADRGDAKRGPRWLQAAIADPRSGEGLAPLAWGARDLPMGAAPAPLLAGSTLRFAAPLELKLREAKTPPLMADWLRLGRNRVARLARQAGHPIWPVQDERWSRLGDAAPEAEWTWSRAERGSSWGAVPKHGFELSEGWRGEAHVDHLPAAWQGWAALFPLVGVGSHIPFGCGIGEVVRPEIRKLASTPPEPEGGRKLVLQWRSGIA